jgi:hypothetical protein
LADKNIVEYLTIMILSAYGGNIVCDSGIMGRVKKQLVLKKGRQKFIFRYESGSEDKLLDVLVEQAQSGRTDFDWFDAAVVSFKLTQSLIGQADELIGENAKARH